MSSLYRPLAVILAGGTAVAAALLAWQHGGAQVQRGFSGDRQFRAAFARVATGMPVAALAKLGFDRHRPGARSLSYLGTLELFMPKNSRDYDRLDPRVRACLQAEDRCGAYVFGVGSGAGKAPLLDFAAHAAEGEGARAVFLVRNGRVVFKRVVGE